MANERKVLWVDKIYFRGWACSGCYWRVRTPLTIRRRSVSEIKDVFDSHDCSQYRSLPALLLPDNPDS
jgi:hypothetical protein